VRLSFVRPVCWQGFRAVCLMSDLIQCAAFSEGGLCAFLLLGLSADRAFMQYVTLSDIIQCAVFCGYGLCAFFCSACLLVGLSCSML